MNKLQVLDCTLRDGGYCNNFKFGYINIKKIIENLIEANIDIVECGFLSDKINYDANYTQFNTIAQIVEMLPNNRTSGKFVAMMNYGEFDEDKLPQRTSKTIDGVRVAFHKKNKQEALKVCEKIQNKGYDVFVQAMVSVSYTDNEFLELISQVNKLKPYAFYIVDSFGTMNCSDLTRLFYLIEHNLDRDIVIGFHSHNNMQLSFANAQTLLGIQTNRKLIIDSSVYGMGRGAGNLNTELFVGYLNETQGACYDIKPLLVVIDEVLNDFYTKNPWGYSLSNYLSAFHNAHPNYAKFLDEKKTLAVKDVNEIFSMMEEERKFTYDKEYIEELYLRYMAADGVFEEHMSELLSNLRDKKILLIAPGKSSVDEKNQILEFSKNNSVVPISVNFDYTALNVEYIFVSNIRRFKTLNQEQRKKCIVTSNIATDNVYLKTQYKELLNDEEMVKDNAGLMAIKFLIDCGVDEIYLAGFDGYSKDSSENYADSCMEMVVRNAVLDAMNKGMTKNIRKYATQIRLNFITKPKHINLFDN